MATLQSGPINTGEYVRSSPDSTPLPVGVYKGIVVKTEQKDTNGEKGPGVMVVVEFDITWPEEYSNRKFWDKFNIMNPSPDTVRIAKEALADLGTAAGLPVLTDDEELLGHEIIMELSIEPAKPYVDKHNVKRDGKAQNKCRKYWPIGTDVEAAKKDAKEQKAKAPSASVRAAVPQGASGGVVAKWGGQKPTVATSAQPAQAAHQPAVPSAPTGNVAPWKRNKQ